MRIRVPPPTLGIVTVPRWRIVVPAAAIVLAVVATVAFWPRQPAVVADAPARGAIASPSTLPSPSPSTSPRPSPVPVPPAPAKLPVLDYFKRPPKGFPADAELASIAPIGQALRPTRKLAVYDAPGGKALAYAASTISGVPLVMPVVGEKQGWRSVILPSVNRTVGWVPPTGWTAVELHDQLVVHLKTHRLVWLRDGRVLHMWTVALGTSRTPTPRGRTFVLARTSGQGGVYAGVDILALGAVPDHPDAVAAGLSDAHTGIHAWYDSSVFGKNVSNGCIRIPRAAQLQLVGLVPGTEVLVID
jgi:lipoprotein-anchoring transpeptidase ErfK/SrfK